MKCVVKILSLILFMRQVECAKILGVFPMAARSHYILGNALFRGLAEAGHDVTMISPFAEDNPPKGGKWRDIVLTGFVEEFEVNAKEMGGFLSQSSGSFISLLSNLPKFATLITDKTLSHPNVLKLMKSKETFDAVIVGQFINDAMKALATLFNGHLIIFSSIGPNSMFNDLVGNPSLPSYAPEVFLNLPPKMSFLQRLQNTVFKFVLNVFTHFVVYPGHDKLIKKYISESLDIDDVLYNASLVLVNNHISVGTPLPYVPCMVDIGGFHIKPSKKLPIDLQNFLDDAKEGVIYFSMGSNIKSKEIPVDTRNAILKAFSKLKQKVLWKWEDDVLPAQPSNVKLGKWLPQQSILAHPNVKVFITHGGLLSTTETIYYGVPIVAIPIFGDQKMNAYAAKVAGYGLVLPYEEISEETLSANLEEILKNPKYRNEVKRRSIIMHDRQIPPLDNAVYWVEYVIRHNGARHLRVAYLDLAWYQYYLLDVLAFISVVIIVIYFIIKKLIRLCKYKTVMSKVKKR